MDTPESLSDHLDEVSLLYLANAGTGVGGARPKALVYESGTPYLAKFNRAINNTDDHERNFSLIHDGEGYCMAPAYDIVPSLVIGAYPVAGYQYSPTAPKPSEVTKKGKIFGLPKTIVKQIADEVINSVEQWQNWAQQYNVSDEDISSVYKVLQV
ncbi:HipA domain-containing protein [sulfur-oxidizing endosymbiont of Gigantopelta aegis]|uniref:HipA domain-containing protein n=1 Tax=sulfur-oxidizing endosymbiont of Gigantopelta aegis TaxID=2794934 RepID=UPI001FE5E772|nr:HipA domain-containing protein [sulfur-oxidizing endosymbiont of Gigantopelta aegis]